MRYVNLGRTGLRVSRVCLGIMGFGTGSDRPWVIDEDAAEPIVRAAVEGGITFFDTADAYSGGASERATGRCVPVRVSNITYRPLPRRSSATGFRASPCQATSGPPSSFHHSPRSSVRRTRSRADRAISTTAANPRCARAGWGGAVNGA